MGLFDRFKKKEEHVEVSELPEELEKFRIKREEYHEIPRVEEKSSLQLPPIGTNIPVGPEKIEKKEIDKLDLVLAKLETINERLRVIEEKLEKR